MLQSLTLRTTSFTSECRCSFLPRRLLLTTNHTSYIKEIIKVTPQGEEGDVKIAKKETEMSKILRKKTPLKS